MKRIIALIMTVAFALPLCFADKLTVPAGKGKTEEIGDEYSEFLLEDANNDGYLDIAEYLPRLSGTMGIYSYLYIYNPKERKFEKLDGEFFNLNINGDGTISETTKADAMGTAILSCKLKWNGKKFKMMSSEYYLNLFLSPNDSQPTVYSEYKTYAWESNDDEKVLSEKYYKETSSGKKIEVSKSEFEKAAKEFGY